MKLLVRISLAIVLCGSLPLLASEPRDTFVPGQTYFCQDQRIEYLAGDLPFILSAPHGGRDKSDTIPDRKEGTFAFDVGTQELARAIAAEMKQQTGHWPHIVICRISRRKVDCNREIQEACAGNADAEVIWNDYHRFLGAARERVIHDFGRGLYIDLHGHGHQVPQLELGYLHSAADLDVSDEALAAPAMLAKSSLRSLAAMNRRPYAEIIRGDFALGTLLADRGFPSTPSKQSPKPKPPYFNGGYNTVRYGREGAPLAGLQIETNSKGVRDNDASRAKFAKALTASLQIYFEAQLGVKLAAKEKPAATKPPTLIPTSAQPVACISQPTCCPRRYRCRRR